MFIVRNAQSDSFISLTVSFSFLFQTHMADITYVPQYTSSTRMEKNFGKRKVF